MGDNGIKAVIFDLGNVLIDFDHTIAAKRITEFTDKSPQEIFNLFFDSNITGLFEEGKISPGDFFLEIQKMLGLRLSYSQFLPIWNEIFFLTDDNKEVYRLAQSLGARYKVALLSNINILHFDYLKANFHIFDAFPNVITSFETRVRKPDPAIYRKALDLLGVPPQNTFYTDDRADLIEKAKGLGIRGFVFTGAEQLKNDLISNSISIS
jgi:glucose-1-phosphatase